MGDFLNIHLLLFGVVITSFHYILIIKSGQVKVVSMMTSSQNRR